MFRRTYFVTNKRIPFEQSFALTAEGGDNSQTRPRSEKASGTAVSRTASAYAAFKESEAHALFRGRGALGNPANRFEVLHVELDPEEPNEDEPRKLATRFYLDATRTIVARNNSPDVGFETSVNPYRGCEHGCVYCFARPTHEYLGFSAGLDFESRIMVKQDAPQLLEAELSSPKWKPQTIVMSGVTDCYQPVERRLKLTRRCLQVLARFRNPVGILTKNRLVTRDIDLLRELAAHHAVAVNISVTSLDPRLQRILEPRTSPPQARLDAVAQLRAAGIPVGVMVAPVIPGITDHEVPAIVDACGKAGAQFAGYVVLRLPWAVAPLFERWLEEHFPDRKEKVLGRIRSMRGGEKLYDSRWSKRQEGEGIFAEQIGAMFEVSCRRAGMGARPVLSTASFRLASEQLKLF
ncbi:MAG: PA0069 family radical SAM protein [Chthoniobacterales bacterium]|nr:PA0069 family radical SAM protein [Chthoniobacterales bacterium]